MSKIKHLFLSLNYPFLVLGIALALIILVIYSLTVNYSARRIDSDKPITVEKDENKANEDLVVAKDEIKYQGKLIETWETLPYLFLEEGLTIGDNVKYAYSVLDNKNSENKLLRIDKLVYDAAHYSNRVTVFYLYNYEKKEYKRVLQSTREQNEARFPETEIISQDPLTVRFYYDISRPLGCYGDGCRSYWAEYFRWDSDQEKFAEVNGKFVDFYKDLLKKYETINVSGCDLGDIEEKQLKTLEEVYNSSETNYCIDTIGTGVNKREDLNKFFEYKKRLLNLVNNNQSNTESVLTKYYPLRKGNYWEYEGTQREQLNAKDIEASNVKKKVEVLDIIETEAGAVVSIDGESDYLIKGNNVYSRESWGDELGGTKTA